MNDNLNHRPFTRSTNYDLEKSLKDIAGEQLKLYELKLDEERINNEIESIRSKLPDLLKIMEYIEKSTNIYQLVLDGGSKIEELEPLLIDSLRSGLIDNVTYSNITRSPIIPSKDNKCLQKKFSGASEFISYLLEKSKLSSGEYSGPYKLHDLINFEFGLDRQYLNFSIDYRFFDNCPNYYFGLFVPENDEYDIAVNSLVYSFGPQIKYDDFKFGYGLVGDSIGRRHSLKMILEMKRKRLNVTNQILKLNNDVIEKVISLVGSEKYNIEFNITRQRDLIANRLSFFDFLFYSVGISTTTTFGDITPNSSGVRILISMQLISCMFIISGLIGSVLNATREVVDNNVVSDRFAVFDCVRFMFSKIKFKRKEI
ncbi:ion channel [Vibrio vulnificus]|uniref:ion channel n=1 Tax=Vibrio vulnificus TaxID=672 RepID=UPI003EDA6918